MEKFDESFFQEIEHRPKQSTIEAENIPLIDLSPVLTSDPSNTSSSITNLVAEIGDACKNWGFFQVINHGVPSTCRENIERASREFFLQPTEEKRKVRRDEDNPTGFYDTEHTKNVRDWKEVFDFVVENPTILPASHEPHDMELKELTNQWPNFSTNFREVCEEYARGIEKLSYKLLELIALSLGLSSKRLNSYFKDQTSFMRLNYYPLCPIRHLALGVGRHKDSPALTVLAQDDVGGLEVKRKTDGEWIQVKPTPDAYIVNVGDIIQVWSNDRYESVEHRVVASSKKERFSIPFFFSPSHYPEYPPELREVCEEYVQEVQKLSYKLLELISLSLGLPAKRMNWFFKDQTSFVRLNHYPPCPIPQPTLGVGRHKDAGRLTILVQDDIGGLEVKRRTDGEWNRVRPTPDAYNINVGDTIQVWSNDEYESVEHRVVVNSERERFSIPFFLNPSHYTWIEPLEELVNEKKPANSSSLCLPAKPSPGEKSPLVDINLPDQVEEVEGSDCMVTMLTFSGPKQPNASQHFVLVHGAYHGAWSWYKLVALMRSPGHSVTAVDLGASGINPKQFWWIRHFQSHGKLPRKDFSCCVCHRLMPGPTLNATTVYIEDLALATTVLRPLCAYSVEDVSKEMVLSSKRYGSVRRVFIVSAEDKLLKKEFQQCMIEKDPPDEVKEIQGSDHMVMMSKPLQLFNLLLSIAHK
ncbi:hypothetical protein K7X08_008828 [Anisodus acutangulus]|uniref:Fe2OG dioxygenase domain-containing protein n=1 Tax=Anisodus acutangulus TaxID=402998 RepID=A0A9Q1RT10_9SOLA|nr:hypothetical protein K7X08_008828 [Anisodus acutangulus]